LAAPFDRALRDAIDAAIAGVPGAELTRAVDVLSRRYRAGVAIGIGPEPGPGLRRLTDVERLAYAAVRLPATAAALDAVFDAVARHTRVEPRTIADLGAGPGTVLWPAQARWPGLERVTLLDRDVELLRLGRRLWDLGRDARQGRGPEVVTRTGDLAAADVPAADLVVISYALNELAEASAARAVDRALALATGALVVVEPGTPAGFARIRAARDRLRAAGATIAAPCPHGDACPMAGGDWCHFAVRLARSRAHRLSKHAALGWEDEKFAYVVAVPDAAMLRARAAGRAIRRPRKDSGHVRLMLCAAGGLTETVVTRRDPHYRDARDAEWGTPWPPMGHGTAGLDPTDA
jgi:ribosomal protein RSM22 (predicted rRNA methylase)